jgi:hypothetical protein
MPIPKRGKKKPTTGEDSILVGTLQDRPPSGLASLLEDPVPTRRGAGGPRLHPSPPFLLRHWPANWSVVEVEGAPLWLPDVDSHLLVAGAAGIRTPSEHEPPSAAYSDAVTRARQDGWIYLPLDVTIPTDLLPEGVPAGRYRRRISGHHPVTRLASEAWVRAWCVPVSGLPSEALRFRLDVDSWNRWRRSLVASGTIPAPPSRACEVYERTIRRHLGRAINANQPESVKARRVEALERRLTATLAAEVPA